MRLLAHITHSPRRSLLVAVIVAVPLVLLVPTSSWSANGPAVPPRVVPSAPRQAPITAQVQAPAQTNTIYTSLTPCRIVDTRAAGGALASGATKSFAVSGTTGFTAHGGNASGCGVPAAATSVAMSIIAVSPAKSGYLTAWPAGSTKPLASVLNYTKGQTSNTGTTMTIRPAATPALSVYASSGPVHVIIDVSGYYAPQMHGLVSPASSGSTNAPIFAGSSRLVSATNPSAGVYTVTFDSNITYCTPMVDTYNAGSGIYGSAYAFSGNTATVFTWYLNSTTHLEVPFSYYFYIDVVC